jgi:hypothetical protein
MHTMAKWTLLVMVGVLAVPTLHAAKSKAKSEATPMSYMDVDVQPGITEIVHPWTREEWFGKRIRATFSLVVSERGVPREIALLETDDMKFGEAMTTLLRRFRFVPAKFQGKPVACSTLMVMGIEVDKDVAPGTANFRDVRRVMRLAENGKPGSTPDVKIRSIGSER